MEGWPGPQTVAPAVLFVLRPLAKPGQTRFLPGRTQMLPPGPAYPLEWCSLRKRRAFPCEPLLSVPWPLLSSSLFKIHFLSPPSEHNNMIVRLKYNCHINKWFYDNKDLNLFRHLISFPWFSTELQFEYLFSGWKGFETSGHRTCGVGAEWVQAESLGSAQAVHAGRCHGARKPVPASLAPLDSEALLGAPSSCRAGEHLCRPCH